MEQVNPVALGRGYRVYRIFTASRMGLGMKSWDCLGEQERKSVDRWD